MLALMLAGLVAAAPDHVTLEEFQYAPDGDDYAPAFERMQQALASRPSTLLKAAGPKVLLSFGKIYPLGRTVRWCLPMDVEGAGQDASAFQVKGAFTPFEQHAENKCPFGMAFADKATGRYSLRRLSILDKSFADQTFRAGLDITWTVTVEDVKVRGFIVGIMVHGDATPEGSEEVTNANLTVLNNVTVSDAQGPGLMVGEFGANNTSDTNVVRTYGGSFQGNCTAGSYWAPQIRPVAYCAAHPTDIACTDPSLACAGVYDASFLGGLYTAPHSAGNKDIATLQKFSGYVAVGDSNRTVFIAPYSESFACIGSSCTTPGGGNYMGPQVMVYGGHSNWVGPGTWQVGNQINAMVARNELDPANMTSFSVGSPNAPGSFWEMRADADSLSKAWRSEFIVAGSLAGWYGERFAASNSFPGLLRGGEKSKIRGQLAAQGALWLPGPVYYGAGQTAVREGQGLSTARPAIDSTPASLGAWPDGSTWRRTGTSSAGAVILYEAQTVASVRKWVPILRRP